MMKFVNLYTQTEYSLLSSSIALKSLIEKVKEYNYPAIAITDSAMHGVIKFYQQCLANQIKPVIGLRVTLVNYGVLLLYAKSYRGYENLLKLASLEALGNVNIESIAKYNHDLICVLPGDESNVVRLLLDDSTSLETVLRSFQTYSEIYPDIYLGIGFQTQIMQVKLMKLLKFGQDNDIKMVLVNKTNYLDKDDFEVFTTLKCISIGANQYLSTEKENNSHLLSVEEVNNIYKLYPSLVSNTFAIANLCNVIIPFGQYRLPKYPHPNSKDYLTELCKVGLNKRLHNLHPTLPLKTQNIW